MRPAHLYNIIQRWIFLIAVMLLIGVNYYFFFGTYGGASLSEITGKYYTATTPAMYSFAIWSLIYATLLIFGFFQLKRGKEILLFRRVFPYFLIVVACNIGWLFAFSKEFFGLALGLILVLLGCLVVIYQKFSRTKHLLGTTRKYFFQVPFSMYLAWISIAAFLSLAILLQAAGAGWYLQHDVLAGYTFKGILFIAALYMLYRHNDYIYPAIIAWGIFAIGFEQDGVLSAVAKIMAAFILLLEIVHFTRDRILLSSYGNIESR